MMKSAEFCENHNRFVVGEGRGGGDGGWGWVGEMEGGAGVGWGRWRVGLGGRDGRAADSVRRGWGGGGGGGCQ